MAAAVKVWSREWLSVWLGHGCSRDCVLSKKDVATVWAWMLRAPHELFVGARVQQASRMSHICFCADLLL